MIRRTSQSTSSAVKVTFSIPDTGVAAAVITDATEWDASRLPLVRRSNGSRSATLTIAKGSELKFRYAFADGSFDNDGDADRFEPNPFGSDNAVLVV